MNNHKVAWTVGLTAVLIIIGQWYAVSQINTTEKNEPPAVLGTESTASPSAMLSQVKLKELVNESFGYKFKYPSNWNAISIQEKAEIISNTNPAKITIDASTEETNFQIENESVLTDNQKEEAQKILKTIQSTFQTFEKTITTEEEISG